MRTTKCKILRRLIYLLLASAAAPDTIAQPIDFFLQEAVTRTNGYLSPYGSQSGSDLRLDYWSMPEVVAPGQHVVSGVGYSVLGGNPGAIVYKHVLADWAPSSPLVVLEDGEAQGAPRAVHKDFTFTAPTAPGTYRMRLAMTWAFKGIQNFYGDGPWGDSSNPGVGPYAEVVFRVESPPGTDYFLQEAVTRTNGYFSPYGSQSTTDFRMDYWSLPEVVAPGQTVVSTLGYSVMGGNPAAIVYKTVLAEWAPTSPIAVIENNITQGSPRAVQKTVTFTAPTTPGTYRLRLAMTWAFKGIQNFYGDGPWGNSANPGVGPYAEVTFRVAAPPATDYFLIHSVRSNAFVSAHGSQSGSDLRMDFWSLPKVVAPGQTVISSIGYSVLPTGNANAVVYKTVLAEWLPDSPLAMIDSGLQGPARVVQKDIMFTAPTTPGVYRLRLALAWAFQGIQHFYGDGPWGGSSNPGVTPYSEISFVVKEADQGNPQDGLVAHYTLDGSATNILGTGNNGVLNGVIPSADRFGNAGSASYLDGSATIDTPSGPPISSTSSVTYSFWLMSTLEGDYISSNPGAWDGVWFVDRTAESWPTLSLALMVNPYGEFMFHPRCDDPRYPTNTTPLRGGQLLPKTWQHIALVRDYGKSFHFYVDGVMAGSAIYDNGSPLTLPPIRLGKHAWNGDQGFTGSMDDFRIYNRALTPTDVSALYNEGPVWLKTRPVSQVASTGGTAIFGVQAVGSPPLTYKWFHNGSPIEGQSGSVLELRDIGNAQTGTYSVTVSNAFREVTTSAKLSLLDLKPVAGLEVSGMIGDSYKIEYRPALDNTASWQTLSTITLTNASMFFMDVESANSPKRFYRAVPVE